jgi:hypothetical protein
MTSERMTSERKAAASRRNGRASRGPRSAAGKSIASRNALRHGLAAITHRQPAAQADIERFAKALCDGDNDPALLEQARIIANNELVLRAISAQQLAVVERVREPSAVALAKGSNDLKLAKQRSRKAKLAVEVLGLFRDKLLKQYRSERPAACARDEEEDRAFGGSEEIVPYYLLEFLRDKEAAEDAPESLQLSCELAAKQVVERDVVERDEGAAFEEAAADLVRLDRYERRAWSRQKRAICAFINIKIMRRLGESLAEKGLADNDHADKGPANKDPANKDPANNDLANADGSLCSGQVDFSSERLTDSRIVSDAARSAGDVGKRYEPLSVLIARARARRA